jgi:hypothetical protein
VPHPAGHEVHELPQDRPPRLLALDRLRGHPVRD